MKNHKWFAFLLTAVMTAALMGCSGNAKQTEKTIRIGSKDFTESLVVAEIYALALEDAGFAVERTFDIAGTLVHTSIISDEIDLYPEYTGTGLLSILQLPLITDPQTVYDTVKEEYEKQFDLTWLEPSAANDGQGIVIRTELAEELGIKTLSDFQKHAGQIRFASQGEFEEREDGLPGMAEVYGPFDFDSLRVYDNGLKYQILASGEADAAPAYTTEGQLVNTELYTLLEDDKQVWPPYYLAPVVTQEILEQYPEIAETLNRINKDLDTETVTSLNAKVDVDGQEYEEVAKEYYDSLN